MKTPKLIVLRGPSGSGKSTVAKLLFESAKHKAVLIEQDHYRFIFNPPGGGTKPNIDTIHKMIRFNTLAALKDGYDVILEGILNVKSYSEVLEDIFKEHKNKNYMFYFDISFEETVRRHKTRVPDGRPGEEVMIEWYPAAHRSGHKLENIIPEEYSIDKTTEFIKQVTGF